MPGSAGELLRASPVRVEFGAGRIAELGRLTRECGAARVLVVSDRALCAAGHVERALQALRGAGVAAETFLDVAENPTTQTVERGLERLREVDRGGAVALIVGLGGGSVMDCAKAVNLLHRCGGCMADYRGDPAADVLAARPALLPMILVPTTAGTGSEAQSFALISDPQTHMKMACGDRRLPVQGGLRPMIALLDPQLSATQPRAVAAATGLDAIAHAVETSGCRVRSPQSREFSRAAWGRLSGNFERALSNPADAAAGEAMLLGAHLAGCAIEQSMLGAAHACANPITAHFQVTHGVAVGVMLPHVVRRNAADAASPHAYADLEPDVDALCARLEALLRAAGVAPKLSAHGVTADSLDRLATGAMAQWTAGFNPRPLTSDDFRNLYRAAL